MECCDDRGYRAVGNPLSQRIGRRQPLLFIGAPVVMIQSIRCMS
jgi:hypothetical protein